MLIDLAHFYYNFPGLFEALRNNYYFTFAG